MKLPTRIVLPLTGLLLAACSASVEGPDEDAIEQHLQFATPTGYEVADVSIEAVENAGSQVDPIYRSRVLVEMRLTEEFVKLAGMVGGTAVVRPGHDEGDTFPGIIITRATPVGDGWNIEIERDERQWLNSIPVSFYADSGFVLENSSDHDEAVRAEQRRQQQAAQEQRRRVAEIRRHFAGTWRSTGPMLVNTQVWLRNNARAGFELTLNPVQEGLGRGVAKLYTLGDQSNSVQTGFTYQLPDGAEIADIRFDSFVNHRGLGFPLNPQATWHLDMDGTLSTNFLRNYTAPLEKVR